MEQESFDKGLEKAKQKDYAGAVGETLPRRCKLTLSLLRLIINEV